MKPTEKRIKAIRDGLPLGGLRMIERETGLDYNLIHRTLQGIPVKWTERNDRIIEAALKILQGVGKALAKTGKGA